MGTHLAEDNGTRYKNISLYHIERIVSHGKSKGLGHASCLARMGINAWWKRLSHYSGSSMGWKIMLAERARP